jgi:diguanylate cyclase (GGDEF)-like protein
MAKGHLASTKTRLILTGIACVAVSLILSLLATHISFLIEEEVTYWSAMVSSAVIPLIVAPIAFGYVGWLSWQLKEAHDRLERLAHQDPLTSLANRRAFVECAQDFIASGQQHVLAMIDIDHFKRINDQIGHAGGDNALKHAAEVLRRSAPKDALVARLGGEQFGILFPLPNDEGGAAAAASAAHIEAMRLQLESLPLITPQGRILLTASFGLALSRMGEPLDALLRRADMAMYAAKNAGRNRLHVAM